MRLQGENGIVTDSASRIDRGIALAMAKERAHIALIDVNEKKH
ncbi:hypothetical protein ABET41_08795 [Metabacillus fastidiosus]|uniref:Uncharacterized protein n=1 Tax=Metabacillus fastidiosus TaxID=1458 RepID=A0ABU6NXK8_9BACI|nr:hypothetical protein [Metabacillus fastidiosus]MED4400601.1 hypothetical protein [Metabacillus fastidiosus]MED4464504.1 hypothetical protein [Metabacillus fastidiosus]